MEITVRAMNEGDLDEADRVVRLAFGTFLGVPDPSTTFGDADYARSRFYADPAGAFSAFAGDRFVGSNYVTRWGSFGFFGPLSVAPDLWDRGIARRLLDPAMDLFESSGVTLRGLFTFPHSTKHVGLYQRYGFWPRFLTAVCQHDVEGAPVPSATRLTDLAESDRGAVLGEARRLFGEIHEGLDPTGEIESVDRQRLGDTIFLGEGSRLESVAVCHVGAGSEAGSGSVYVKLAAVRPETGAAERFDRLLDAIEGFALQSGVRRVVAGVNTGREAAYRRLLGRGYRPFLQGVAMTSPSHEGFSRTEDYVLDDWR